MKLENKLQNEISKYLQELGIKVQTTYMKASEQGIPLHNIKVLIQLLFKDWHQDYTGIITKYQQKAHKLSKKQNKELIRVQQKRTLGHQKTREQLNIQTHITIEDTPLHIIPTPLQALAIKAQSTLEPFIQAEKITHYRIEENPIVRGKLEQQTFKFCEKTRARVTNEINQILTNSETQGIGNREVGKQIQDKFQQLKTYEAERIARTEINRANNEARYEDLIQEDLIDYYQWSSTHDPRTRDTHREIDGEIVRKGELFSNGLRFPGDPNGKAKEVINCRCTLVPWICPYDKVVPSGLLRFRESQLVPRPEDDNKTFLLETIENTRIITPVEGGIEVHPERLNLREKILGALGKLVDEVTNGKIKNKKQLQTTLDDILLQQQTPSKPHHQIIRELEEELEPVVDDIRWMEDDIYDLRSEIEGIQYREFPHDDKIKKLEQQIDALKKPHKFDVDKLSPEQMKEWERLSSELLAEVTDDYPSTQTIQRRKAALRVFMNRNVPKNKFDINLLSPEQQEQYHELLQREKDGKLSFGSKIQLRKLREKGRTSIETQKKIEKLENKVQELKDMKRELIASMKKRGEKELQKMEQELQKLQEKQKQIELKIGKQHLKNQTKPSQVVISTDELTTQGQTFKVFNHIEENQEDYHKFCQVLNSQKSNTPYGITKYSEGSGHFNRYLELKKAGDPDAIEDNILNALVHPRSIYKLNDEEIIKPLNQFECADNPQLIKDAIKKLKKKLHNGDPKVKKAYDELLNSFKREEKEIQDNLIEFKEGIVTFSGQNLKNYGHLQVGDIYEAPKCVSSSLTEDVTDFFLTRRAKKGDKPIKIRFFHQKCTKQVVIGERSIHPREAEILQVQGTRGRVIGRGTQKFEYFGEHWEEITIDTLDILLDCQK